MSRGLFLFLDGSQWGIGQFLYIIDISLERWRRIGVAEYKEVNIIVYILRLI